MIKQKTNDEIDEMIKEYIYESPDGGQTVYRREIGETGREIVETVREIVDTNSMISNPSDYTDLISIDVDTIDLDTLSVTAADTVTMVDPFIFDGNDHKSTVEDRLGKIEKRLAILEPKQELLDKYEVLQSLYEQYKAAEAMLMGPDPEDEE